MIEVNMTYPVIEADVNIPKTVNTGDMSNYYTKPEVDRLIENVEVDLTGYATETYVDQKIKDIDIPEVDLTGFATENYVDNKVKNSADYLMDQIGSVVTEIEENYATKEDVDNIDLTDFYTKPEVDVLIDGADKIHIGNDEPTDGSLIWISQDGLNEPVASENYVEETINSAIGTVLEGEY